ncbi:MAG: hypothetical protein WCJ51_00775 [Candidatus Moraniibacteriota bacterium]
MQIISISGLDGSGKSTQIELLKKKFETEGKKVFYFHAVAFSIANKKICHSERISQQDDESKNLSAKSLDYARAGKSSKSVTSANWLQIQLRKVALAIDLIRFQKLLQELRSENYDYLLSDRYFYDNVINILYLAKTIPAPWSLLSCLASFIPRPDFAFFLSADPKKIMQRPRPAEQGLEYLLAKQRILTQFAQDNNLFEIDGNKTQQEVFGEIEKVIGNQ